ncbi:MAG: imidazolonepropionase [Tissierella sp.]|uniref:imidazolonepropionase n=1 Tax=Tissierella sp. TaxID=41274 RepID=UPI003F969367
MKATLVIKNIDNLITLKGENRARKGKEQGEIGLIKNGVVAVKDKEIIYVGEGELPESIEVDASTEVIDGKGKTVTPGLIDSHTHLVHGGSREHEFKLKLEGVDYLDILASGGGIHSTVEATREASFDDLYKRAEKSLKTMLSFGVTTVESKSGYGIGDFDTELRQIEVSEKLNEDYPSDIISTFMGAHAVPEEYEGRSDEFVDVLINEMMPKVIEKTNVKFNDVFCEEGVFTVDQSRKILLAGKEQGLIPKMHADEIVSLGGAELAAEVGCISAEHLMAASDQGIDDMAKSGTIAVLLPGTSFNLQKGTIAPARKMIEKNVPVAISTDYNPGSCPSENLQFMMTLGSLTLKMTPAEVITSVTINAAAALDVENEKGSLQKGKRADISIFDTPNLEYMIYHFGINHTDKVIKDGKVVWNKENNRG